MTKDNYRILDMLENAEDIVIRAAYKVIAQKYHPHKSSYRTNEISEYLHELIERLNHP